MLADLSINDLVHFIKDPAYIVDEDNCVVSRNISFDDMTNFNHETVDKLFCYQIIEAVKIKKRKPGKYQELICKEQCPYRAQFRGKHKPAVIKHAWINCNDKQGNPGKCLVDIYIFPFQTQDTKKDDKKIYSLHILQYRGERHSLDYYRDRFKLLLPSE